MVAGVVRPGVVPIYGTTGRDGASAYLLAKNAGFPGTEAEWLASLQGPQGIQGMQGLPGADGTGGGSAAISADPGNLLTTGTDAGLFVSPVPGPKGDDGVQGIQGIQGIPGNTGLQGTPGTPGTNGTDGTPGIDGIDGTNGTDGVGVPVGGTAGQVLAKIDATDYNTQWTTPSAGGGGTVTQATLTVLTVVYGYAEVAVASLGVTSASKVTVSLVGQFDAENDIMELVDSAIAVFAVPSTDLITFVLTGNSAFTGQFVVNYGVA